MHTDFNVSDYLVPENWEPEWIYDKHQENEFYYEPGTGPYHIIKHFKKPYKNCTQCPCFEWLFLTLAKCSLKNIQTAAKTDKIIINQDCHLLEGGKPEFGTLKDYVNEAVRGM